MIARTENEKTERQQIKDAIGFQPHATFTLRQSSNHKTTAKGQVLVVGAGKGTWHIKIKSDSLFDSHMTKAIDRLRALKLWRSLVLVP